MRQGVNKQSIAILGGTGLALAGWSLGSPRVSGPWRARVVALAFGLPFVALPLLDLFALSAYILPQLDKPSCTLFSSNQLVDKLAVLVAAHWQHRCTQSA